MTHNRLSNYQIAEYFGEILSLIYKEKMKELNNESKEAYAHIDKLQIPQVPEFHRYFAKASMPYNVQEKFKAIEHINKIRSMHKKMKDNPESLNIDKAKSVPISSLYDFTIKKNMISCPFHTDKHPSMKINKDNTVKCFSCGFFGDSIALIMRLEKKSFKESVEYLNKL